MPCPQAASIWFCKGGVKRGGKFPNRKSGGEGNGPDHLVGEDRLHRGRLGKEGGAPDGSSYLGADEKNHKGRQTSALVMFAQNKASENRQRCDEVVEGVKKRTPGRGEETAFCIRDIQKGKRHSKGKKKRLRTAKCRVGSIKQRTEAELRPASEKGKNDQRVRNLDEKSRRKKNEKEMKQKWGLNKRDKAGEEHGKKGRGAEAILQRNHQNHLSPKDRKKKGRYRHLPWDDAAVCGKDMILNTRERGNLTSNHRTRALRKRGEGGGWFDYAARSGQKKRVGL